MTHKKTYYFSIAAMALMISFFLFEPSFADIGSDITNQLQATAGPKGGALGPGTDPRIIASRVIRQLLTVIGTLMLAFTFWGGFLIMTAAGESEQVEKGKNTLTRAIIGLVIVLTSYSFTLLITNLILVDKTPIQQIPERNDLEERFINRDPLNQDPNIFR